MLRESLSRRAISAGGGAGVRAGRWSRRWSVSESSFRTILPVDSTEYIRIPSEWWLPFAEFEWRSGSPEPESPAVDQNFSPCCARTAGPHAAASPTPPSSICRPRSASWANDRRRRPEYARVRDEFQELPRAWTRTRDAGSAVGLRQLLRARLPPTLRRAVALRVVLAGHAQGRGAVRHRRLRHGSASAHRKR